MKRRSDQWPHARPYADRHGKRRWRYRVKGFTAELGTEFASDDFIRRYEAAEGRSKAGPKIGASRTAPGSFDALAVSWYRSPAFLDKAKTTQTVYRNIIEELRQKHGPKRVAHIERRHVLALIAEKAGTPAAANRRLSLLRMLLDHAIDTGMRTGNPARDVKGYRVESDGFHTWSEDEVSRFLWVHPLGTLAHTAMVLMLYTGAARADAVRLGWGNVKGGRIAYRRQKTRRSNGVLIDMPLHPALAAVLEDLPRDAFTFLQTRDGKSRSPNGLGNMMRKWCDEAGLPDCASHGLRKAIARRLAEAGATPHMIQAVTGHKTLREVTRYTEAANRAGLADDAFSTLGDSGSDASNVTNHPKRFVKNDGKYLKEKEK